MFRTAALLLLAATGPAGLSPGLWQVTSAPGTATLDGRPLGDLPYTPSPPDAPSCLSAAMLRDPVALVVRQTPEGCRETRRTPGRDRVTIGGVCPPQAAGLAGGTYLLEGRWTARRYTVRFTTANPSENGTMGFSGTVSGRRVGDCPR